MSASLLPPRSTPLERGLEAATARAGAVPVPLRDLWNPATCPVALLPWLAWSLSIDNWSPDWSEGIKRARIAQAISIQRHKGTAQSVRDVVAAFGGTVAIREWWQQTPPGDPHTFELILSLTGVGGAPATADFANQVIAEVTRTKPARSHFTTSQALQSTGGIGMVGAVRPALFTRLRLSAPAQS